MAGGTAVLATGVGAIAPVVGVGVSIGWERWNEHDRNAYVRLTLRHLRSRDHHVTPAEALRIAPAR